MNDTPEHRAASAQDAASFLRTLLAVLSRRRKFASAVFLVVLAFVGLAVTVMPRRYNAEAEVLVGDDRPNLVITTSANMSPPLHDVDETQINSEIQLMTSSGLIHVLANHVLSNANGKKGGSSSVPSSIATEKEAKKLERNLQVEAIRKSDVIKLTYTDRDPEQARAVLQYLLTAYLSAHLQAHANPGSYDFFADQATKYLQQLDDVESQITELESRESAVSLPLQEETITKSREDTAVAIINSESSIASDERSLAVGKGSLDSLSPRIQTESTSTPNQYSIERLRTILVELTNKRTELLANFLPNDRQIVELNDEILNTSKTLALTENNQSIANVTNINPVHQAIQTDVTRLQMQLASERARHQSLQRALQTYDQRLAHLASIQQEEQRLLRQQKEDQENYALYAQKQEEARVAQSLDRERFSNVSVIEAPLASYLPSQPKVTLDLFLGLLTAVFVAVCFSFFYDRWQGGQVEDLHPTSLSFDPDRRSA